MTLEKAREQWEKAHPDEDWDALSHEEQMDILTAAVKKERGIADPSDLDSMKKPDLVALAKERGLDSSGTADELRARLAANDA